MIAYAKEKDALNITLSICINSTNVHLCNYCTKIFVIVVNTCVCRRSVDNKAAILSYPILSCPTKVLGRATLETSCSRKINVAHCAREGRLFSSFDCYGLSCARLKETTQWL